MKLTKIFLVVVALCALSCNKEKPEEVVPPPPAFVDNSGINWGAEGDIVGQWSLTSHGYPVQPQIYVEFCEDGTFNLYQRFTDIPWKKYKGSYTLEDNILKGKYSNGESLQTYKVKYGEKENLKYIFLESQEEDAYMQIYVECKIPDYIIDEAKSTTKAVRSTDLAPLL